jgi:putative glycosyltransferase
MKLSIVTTLYKSAAYVEEFYRRASAAAQHITDSYEIVMVDDGSPDNSLEIACAIACTDNRVRVIELSRNFGHHKAMMTGIDYAKGELCFLIDSDLEEDPAVLLEFFERMKASNADVVYGFQDQRKGDFGERISGSIAYRLLNVLLSHPIPQNHITVRLMKRDYVNSLVMHREQETVIGGLWVITGFRQMGIPVDKKGRNETTYSYWHRWLKLVDSVTSFSEKPLVAIFYLGIAISGLSTLVAIALLFHKIVFRGAVEGWVSVMLSVWFLGGLLIFCVGVIGIYVSKIFIETKNRPYTIVRRVHGSAAFSRNRSPDASRERLTTEGS